MTITEPFLDTGFVELVHARQGGQLFFLLVLLKTDTAFVFNLDVLAEVDKS